jgi:uncharacterized protein YjbI with pentapeptide repeats
MRPMAEVFIPVLLVGCLTVAVAVAREQKGIVGPPCEGPYAGRTLSLHEREIVLQNHQAWVGSKGAPDDTRKANLCQAELRWADLRSAILSDANLQEARLIQANLQEALLIRTNLQEAHLGSADLQRANLRYANLRSANLVGANLQEAILGSADLQRAFLGYVDLRSAILVEANLQEARLGNANLQRANLHLALIQKADLHRANLQEARFIQANLGGANLQWADLGGAVFEPSSLPDIRLLANAFNLEKMTFSDSPAALIELREAFKKEGMRTQERRITYAIEHTRRLQAWDQWGSRDDLLLYLKEDKRSWIEKLVGKGDRRRWPEMVAGKIESLFKYVLFELPADYGMAPGRALQGLLGFIPCFALFYWIALHHASSRSGLWMIVPADRLTRGRGHERVVRIQPHPTKTWRERLTAEFRLFRTSFYFSLLSAFHLGWRELNVGTWIARMQPREYVLRATGWVRFVAGLQSLLSVYLLALWVLTYFGRPFE